MNGAFDDLGNAIVGNIAIPASHVPAFRALLCGERVAPGREALADLWDFDITNREVRLILADKVLASGVLGVSADLIRAETLEAAGREVSVMYDIDPQPVDAWLFERAARYRKAAAHD